MSGLTANDLCIRIAVEPFVSFASSLITAWIRFSIPSNVGLEKFYKTDKQMLYKM
jgi:hypothetical protein